MLEESSNKRRRTSEDFLAFCRIILDYENYYEEEEDSGGGGNKRVHSLSKKSMSTTSSSGSDKGAIEDEAEDSKSSSSSSTSSSHDRDKDGFNDVTCYCKKPFAGRPMIECSSCLTWIHLSCAKIKRTHIPDTWNCRKCTDKLSLSSSSPLSSNAKRVVNRKRKTSPPSSKKSINLTI